MNPVNPVSPIFIAGPTAVGKSEIALLLAEKLGGEIISADSMQVYRGLDIGTAKPSADERARVPHHLIDICELTENFDAAQFIRRAQSAVTEIAARGKVPIFCGGTGLYFKAYLSGLGEAPATNPDCAPNWKPRHSSRCYTNCANATPSPTKRLINKTRAASSAPLK
ncbi:MAG: tRNA (adenosine(37)-N6)-dimethylallyltransferase MiaA [Limisphaerales bacterium]